MKKHNSRDSLALSVSGLRRNNEYPHNFVKIIYVVSKKLLFSVESFSEFFVASLTPKDCFDFTDIVFYSEVAGAKTFKQCTGQNIRNLSSTL